MVNFLEFLWAVSALCVGPALYSAMRKRHHTAVRWGLAAGVGLTVCVILELSLPAG